MEHHYLQSYFSEEYKNLTLSPRSLTSLLRDIGVRRDSITNFFKEFKQAKDNILFDGTDLLMFLSEIRKVKINNSWITAEATKKTEDLLNKLGVHIT